MDWRTQERLGNRIRQLRHARSTDLAASSYQVAATDFTDTARLALEIDTLFLRRPLLAGLSAEVRAAGDWFTFDACGRSAVVWRGADGALRAFANACRHRGMQVATGGGHAPRVLTCPYHGRSYDPHGRLCAIPGKEGFNDIASEKLGLMPLPVWEEAGLVYVAFSDQRRAGSLTEGAACELEPFGLASYHRVERREHRFETNWKLTVDSFMEAYHLHTLHKETLQPIFFHNLSAFDAFGRNCRIVGVRRSFDEIMNGMDDRGLLPHVTLLYQLFPNAVLIYQQDHVELYQSFPHLHDPSVCFVRATLYAPGPPENDGEREYWKKNLDLIDHVTSTEDFAACEKIQANLAAGMVPFVIIGRNEPGVAHFHRMLDEVLGTKGEATVCT